MQLNNYISIYEDVFFPPKGYEIEWVELTTWSFAKDWLRIIAAMIAAGNSNSKKFSASSRFIQGYYKEEYFENNDGFPFHVFYEGKYELECEDSSYGNTANGRLSAYLFERNCTAVRLENGLFHPKIILLQFKKTEDCKANEHFQDDQDETNYKFRIFISSRNLTWSNYAEAGVLLESDGKAVSKNVDTNTREEDPSPGKAMSRFLRKYYKDCGKQLPDKLKIDILDGTGFKVVQKKDNQFIDVDSNPEMYFGTECSLINTMIGSFDEYIRNSQNKYHYEEYYFRISSMNPQRKIDKDPMKEIDDFRNRVMETPIDNSKPDQKIRDLHIQYICNFKDMYEKTQSGNTWRLRAECKNNSWYVSDEKSEKKPKAIHLKQYMLWGIDYTWIPSNEGQKLKPDRKDILVWMGSANWSEGGLCKHNEEVMVKFISTQDNSMMPGTLMPTGEVFAEDRNRCKYVFKKNDSVENPELPVDVENEDEQDRRYKIDVEITNARYVDKEDKNRKKYKALQVDVKNNESEEIFVWPATLSEYNEEYTNNYTNRVIDSHIGIEFPMSKSRFSRLLNIRKGKNGPVFYRVLEIKDDEGEIDNDWYGKDFVKRLIKNLPHDEIKELSDLLLETGKVVFSQEDSIYEKLLKCKMNLSSDELRRVINDTQTIIRLEEYWIESMKIKYNGNTEDEDDDYEENLDAYMNLCKLFGHKQAEQGESDLKYFKDLLRKLSNA